MSPAPLPRFQQLQYEFAAHLRDPARHAPPPGIVRWPASHRSSSTVRSVLPATSDIPWTHGPSPIRPCK